MQLCSVYFGGERYRRMASVLEHTAREHCPGWEINVRRIDTRWFTKSHYARPGHRTNTQKMYEWNRIVGHAPDGAELLLIDADTFITRPLASVWSYEFDFAYTTKPGETIPLNTGVVFLRVSPEVRGFMTAWWEKTLHLLQNATEHHRWRKRYGGVSQAALGALLAEGAAAGLTTVELPCQEWNCDNTEWRKFDEKTRVVHVMSKLRRAAFSTEPSRTIGVDELARTWKDLDRRINGHVTRVEPPDLVIPVRPGDQNEELRYALRSFEKNLPHRQVVIVGHKPRWLRGVLHIPTQQTGTKYKNSTRNVEAACRHPEVSETFLLCNDDFFVLKRTEPMPVFHWGPMKDVERYYAARANGAYLKGLRATKELLAELGYKNPLSYELHLPMPMQKRKFLEVLKLGRHIRALHKRTLYGNVALGGDGQEVTDPKVTTTGRRFPKKARFLSTMDSSWKGHVGMWIQKQFPEPSIYEEPPIAQRRAVQREIRRRRQRVSRHRPRIGW